MTDVNVATPRPPARVLALSLPLALAIAGAASAQTPSSRPVVICVENRGAFVATIHIDASQQAVQRAIRLTQRRELGPGQQECVTAPAGSTSILVAAMAMDGFRVSPACTLVIQPVAATTVTLRGTSSQPSCTR